MMKKSKPRSHILYQLIYLNRLFTAKTLIYPPSVIRRLGVSINNNFFIANDGEVVRKRSPRTPAAFFVTAALSTYSNLNASHHDNFGNNQEI